MQFQIILLNFVYAIVGGIVTVFFMFVGYKALDVLTKLDTSDELIKGNRAVGSVVLGMMVGIGVAIGLVIGLGLN